MLEASDEATLKLSDELTELRWTQQGRIVVCCSARVLVHL